MASMAGPDSTSGAEPVLSAPGILPALLEGGEANATL